jgi:hypothetical protein
MMGVGMLIAVLDVELVTTSPPTIPETARDQRREAEVGSTCQGILSAAGDASVRRGELDASDPISFGSARVNAFREFDPSVGQRQRGRNERRQLWGRVAW